MMRLMLTALLAVLLVSILGCGIGLPSFSATCPLDRNGDGQLTEADLDGMTQAQVEELLTQIQSDPLSMIPCLPLIEAAGGTLPELGG